ncbi:hypothetical protein ACJ73_04507 [Blastomyces percursus]|uniref:Uncharacterized protein n=1 Tax=Blastomyces percursus TaxID=1658174 RepID=A0A1J9Q5W6_9EURO|nr:hypothetical protein ACJ73_04507 [Blastomyces percursus]
MSMHFDSICSAIDQLSPDFDFEVPLLLQSGLSQDLKSHHDRSKNLYSRSVAASWTTLIQVISRTPLLVDKEQKDSEEMLRNNKSGSN